MTDERRKAVTDSFNDEVGAWVETYMLAHVMLERASRNQTTGPEAKNVITLEAADRMFKVAEMFERLAAEGHNEFAGKMGWSSAEELSQFLWEGATPAN